MSDVNQALDQHYSDRLSANQILAEVDRLFPDLASPGDFAAIDQLHLGGRGATLKQLDAMSITADYRVLDIGCGLGGSARLIADRYHCPVVGVDITADFCALAEALNQRLKKSLPVAFVQADATQLPFNDKSFDLLISQHCIMNVAEPEKALAEFRRLLKPGGRLLLHEVLQGEQSPPYYPVPWASAANHSFLLDEAKLRQLLSSAGLQIEHFEDLSDTALSWRKHHQQKPQRTSTDDRPLLSPKLIFGDRFPLMAQNLLRNLDESRVRVISMSTCDTGAC